MLILETRNVTKSYGSGEAAVAALRGVTTSISAGEFVAIMGPSGSGKSTLLTILGGVETPSTGEVLVEGVDLASLSDDDLTKLRRRRLGFIFQSFNLLPNLSAEENVALPLELDGVSREKARLRANEALGYVEMTHRKGHLPAQLSGGEQQRVAIARALSIRPALLLADEPTGNLDSRQSKRISALLTHLVAEHQQTIVMVTHDPNVAAIASRIIKIRDGAVEFDGTVKDAQLRPQDGDDHSSVHMHGASS
jgi:putative ABC transport system ATP-binding protein